MNDFFRRIGEKKLLNEDCSRTNLQTHIFTIFKKFSHSMNKHEVASCEDRTQLSRRHRFLLNCTIQNFLCGFSSLPRRSPSDQHDDDAPVVSQDEDEDDFFLLQNGDHQHSKVVVTVPDLPLGWRAVPSRSRPEKVAFLNEFTGERISWIPTQTASTKRGELPSKLYHKQSI